MTSPADIDAYLAERYWTEDDLQRAIRADTAERGPSIEISAESGKFLATIVAMTGARRVLEVGALFGYSGVWLARALPDGGHLDTVEFADLHADAAEHWFAEAGLTDRVTVHRGAGVDVVPNLPGPYDLAFVDADKTGYPDYLRLVLERLRPGGVIVFDNMHWGGRIATRGGGDGADAIREVHDWLAASDEVVATTLGVGDGMTVVVKR